MRSSFIIGARIVSLSAFLLASGLAAENQGQPTTITNAGVPAVEIYDALCRALQDNYPMLEPAGWNDSWVTGFRARVLSAPDRAAAGEVMDELVCRLNDYHTRLSWPDRPRRVSPPFRVEPVFPGDPSTDRGSWDVRPGLEMPPLEGISVAVVEVQTNCAVRIGDAILRVNEVPVNEALAHTWPHAVGSSAAAKLRSAAGRMLLFQPEGELKLTVRRQLPTGDEIVATVNVTNVDVPRAPTIRDREVDGVPVIRIARWSNEGNVNLVAEVDRLLEKYRSRPALVFDVRNNGGGLDQLADEVIGRFLQKPVIASISFRRKVPELVFERRLLRVEPRGPWRYAGRVVVLTDEGCMSATGHFVSGMIEAGALACGTPTSGACGLIRPVDLPGGARVNISRTFPLHTGGLPSPGLGMVPHLWAIRSLADVRAGTDPALQAGLRWAKSAESLPVRRQPLSPWSSVPALPSR